MRCAHTVYSHPRVETLKVHLKAPVINLPFLQYFHFSYDPQTNNCAAQLIATMNQIWIWHIWFVPDVHTNFDLLCDVSKGCLPLILVTEKQTFLHMFPGRMKVLRPTHTGSLWLCVTMPTHSTTSVQTYWSAVYLPSVGPRQTSDAEDFFV